MADLIAAPAPVRIPVRSPDGATFPVRRIFCVGRNFADHAREMGATPADPDARGRPVLFCKPADAIVTDGQVPYPRGSRELHHEVELVVALGRDAPDGPLDRDTAAGLVLAYGVGLDLTRRDLQSEAKAGGMPWDTGKAFDHSVPVSELVPASQVGTLAGHTLRLQVNGATRQHGSLDDLVWDVPDILHELSLLFALKAGDLVFMGTPAGVGPLQPGDRFTATLEGVVEFSGQVTGG